MLVRKRQICRAYTLIDPRLYRVYRSISFSILSNSIILYLSEMNWTIAQIAETIGGKVEGDDTIEIFGPSKIEEGSPGTLTFLGNLKYESFLYKTKASAVLVPEEFQPKEKVEVTLIRVRNVYEALGALLKAIEKGPSVAKGIDQTAIVIKGAKVSDEASIGAFVYIGEGAIIEENVIIHPHSYIGDGAIVKAGSELRPGVRIMHQCMVGRNCLIHSNTVVGSDGFGFSQTTDGAYQKLSQTGNVVIEDDVEIGANVAIDRATMGSTLIKEGVKIDNLVQIAHNAIIGKNTAMAAQVGVAGSTKIGERCIIGGQVGIVGHLNIEDGTMIQAQSGVASSTKGTDTKLYGTPAIAYNQYLRSYVAFSKLPDYIQKIRELEQRIKQLEEGA